MRRSTAGRCLRGGTKSTRHSGFERYIASARPMKTHLSRRKFLDRAAVGICSSALLPATLAEDAAPARGDFPLVISTWPFGKPANDVALKLLTGGAPLLDAVEQGIHVVESDPNNHSVGLAGRPNAAGVVQLDACIMFGPGHRAGGVAALEGIRHPISAARMVMEKTSNVLLVGEGARMFALEQGLESTKTDSAKLYRKWQNRPEAHPPKTSKPGKENHDTIALLVLGKDGNIAGGCSTSGLAGKLPGRVGDSPLIGSGLYVDNEVGAAGATGVGENVMRYCASLLIVEQMRQGLHPQEACEAVIRRIARQDPKRFNLSINFVALDKSGRYGAAGTDANFQFSLATAKASQVLPGKLVDHL